MSTFQTLLNIGRMFSPNKAHPSLGYTLNRRLQIWIDRREGLDFLLVAKPGELGLDENLVHRASPSGNKYLHKLLLDLDIRADDVILDVGCAKGSAMRTMLDFPFRAVDGVELSQQLAAIASANFRRLGKSNVHIFNANAVDFDGYGRYDFLYFYNPFPAEVMRQTISQIQKQLDGSREVVVIYNSPACHEVVVAHGFTAMRDYPDQWGNGIRIYSNRPATSRLLARSAD